MKVRRGRERGRAKPGEPKGGHEGAKSQKLNMLPTYYIRTKRTQAHKLIMLSVSEWVVRERE